MFNSVSEASLILGGVDVFFDREEEKERGGIYIYFI